jgi:glutamate-ammonia-ligase adenylyltransferase
MPALDPQGFENPGLIEPTLSSIRALLCESPGIESSLVPLFLRDLASIFNAGLADPDAALLHLEAMLVQAREKQTNLGWLFREWALSLLLPLLSGSHFLAQLLIQEPERFPRAVLDSPFLDQAKPKPAMLAELLPRLARIVSRDQLLSELRRFKYDEFLRISSRDLSGRAELPAAAAELSDLAETCIEAALQAEGRLLAREFGEPRAEDAQGLPGFCVLGMGKLAGRELNFSSDIDLIYLTATDRGRTAGGTGAPLDLHAFYTRLAENLTRALSQNTADGFVFRVDLRLRPEGRNGPIVNSLEAALGYYESWGQPWERAALAKARPVAGDLELGQRLLQELDPFLFRKFHDFGSLEDLKEMKLSIDRQAGALKSRTGPGYDCKLGRGGIREIEFFIQALLLTYGGKRPQIRALPTPEALDRLRRDQLLQAPEHEALLAAWKYLRTLEHRLQLKEERQLHQLPSSGRDLEILARHFGHLGPDAVDAFLRELQGHTAAVSEIFQKLFYDPEQALKAEGDPALLRLLDRELDRSALQAELGRLGFAEPGAAAESLLALRDGPPGAYFSRRSRRTLESLAPLLLTEVVAAPDPDMALRLLERFLAGIGARSTFFMLLRENPELTKFLVRLFGTSEFLGNFFVLHPELLDDLISADALAERSPDQSRAELQAGLKREGDFEGKLEALRRFQKIQVLRVGLADLAGKLDEEGVEASLTDLAELCLFAAYQIALEDVTRRYGRPEQESGLLILGLGKLGGREMNYASDLDLIFVYAGEGQTKGKRPISLHEFYIKAAQQLINVLTATTREGILYRIDARLRPSGSQGPLVVSLESFERYHRKQAQLWEKQALTKARVMVDAAGISARVVQSIAGNIYGDNPAAALVPEMRRVRERMEKELAQETENRYDLKFGRGGQVDIEYLVQFLALRHGGKNPALREPRTLKALAALENAGILGAADRQVLEAAHRFYRRLENRLRIVSDRAAHQLPEAGPGLRRLARRLGYAGEDPGRALLDDYERHREAVRELFERYLQI